MVIFVALILFMLLEQEKNLNVMKKYVKIKIFAELQCHLELKQNIKV